MDNSWRHAVLLAVAAVIIGSWAVDVLLKPAAVFDFVRVINMC
ncbi:hypothetical protein [Noviherbaspirillum saxi]|nr:hypothetical protein [Noviherbaspirillum saxi]